MAIQKLFQGDPDEEPMEPAPDEQRLDAADATQAIDNQVPEPSAAGEAEKERLQQALVDYRIEHPEPDPMEVVSFWSSIGLEVSGLLLSAVGSMVISALRFGTILFLAEINLTSLYTHVAEVANSGWATFISGAAPTLLGVAGITGFEGLLFSAGYRKGKESGKVQISATAVVVAFIVTISAGLMSSLTLTSTTDPGWAIVRAIIQFFVVLSTGVGAPMIAYYGAENIGVIHNDYLQKKRAAREAYKAAVLDDRQKFLAWYARNAWRLFGVDRSNRSRPPEPEPQAEEVDASRVTAGVKDWLVYRGLTPDDIGIKPGQKYSPAIIAHDLKQPNSDRVRTALVRLRRTWPKPEDPEP